MNDRTWHKGKPPHVGWWRTRDDLTYRDKYQNWRWWDGEQWSCLVYENENAEAALSQSKVPTFIPITEMRWSDYYPANARVPRINPND